MRDITRLNNQWLYSPVYGENMTFEKVNLPHTNIELPYNYFDEKLFQFISCYRKEIEIGALKGSKRATIYFHGVMTKATVYCNEQLVGEHSGGYTPFEFDITESAKVGKNIITVVVDSRELESIPPFGGQIDYLTYGGIYRDVELRIYDEIYFEKIKIECGNIFESEKKVDLILNVNNSSVEKNCLLEVDIFTTKGIQIHNFKKELNLEHKQNEIRLCIDNIKNIELWDLDNPNLYSVKISISAGAYSDEITERVGFRSVKFTSEGFYLNNNKVKLVGINRHQSFPYVGYAMPKRAQIKDADIIKNELHFNLVRTSHYPQSVDFLNRCDEIGLLVFEEIPGWQHIGNKGWQDIAVKNVEEMIERDWNHPSIIIWGVRINESQDNDEFYTRTNNLARKLDPTRQTGGVRYITNSSMLEDVYTMNDFVLDGGETALRNQKDVTGLSQNVPYLVTEYNGHMFPTKRFDNEERQMEHVNRHLRVQNASFGDDNISGAIGWCLYDYNTHNDFGSGDRICYHGITDIFRIPKFASYVYKSQVSPKVEPVLEPVTFWARGERSIGGIMPLTILTNCDYVELQYGDSPKLFKIYRKDGHFSNLPYPPIVIDTESIPPAEMGEWGMRWEDGIIKGFVDGKEVITKKLSSRPLPKNLELVSDDIELSSSEKDVARFVIKVTDNYGNLLPFYETPVNIEIDGPVKLQGPSVLTLKGGAFGFWIETLNQKGEAKIRVKSSTLESNTVTLKIV
ncbi:MAG: glycoside hydrolase family 2 protein [Spirochaetales bacterium]|nr:glycoside hydrolase family 2 protein [Spirochaetales bacterium]